MRRPNFQTIAWFWDLYNRERLELSPPYQSRSVWNQAYKDYFIDTVLLEYPAPAIFLFEEIGTDGVMKYNVVDGKQRLTAVFEFLRGDFPVFDNAQVSRLRGKYFEDLDDKTKRSLWGYQFLVEYVHSSDEAVINNIFDRINRNVARLTAQELRHAQFYGEFITAAEDLADWMTEQLPQDVPRITPKSRKQMRDVEFVSQLLLLIERGPKGYSSLELDEQFSERDVEWPEKLDVVDEFRATIGTLENLFDLEEERGQTLSRSRLRNQADFYSLFGAIVNLERDGELPDEEEMKEHLVEFIEQLESEDESEIGQDARDYLHFVRSASNDTGSRSSRIEIMRRVLLDDQN